MAGQNTDDAQTFEGWEEPQWDATKNRWQTRIDSIEDFTKVVWSETGPRYGLIAGGGIPQKIARLFINPQQMEAWKMLRSSLSEFIQVMKAKKLTDEFVGGRWSFQAYAKLRADAKEFEIVMLMTMEAEKRQYAATLIREHEHCSNQAWFKNAWFRAVVHGSSAMTGEMEVEIVGAEVIDAAGDVAMVDP